MDDRFAGTGPFRHPSLVLARVVFQKHIVLSTLNRRSGVFTFMSLEALNHSGFWAGRIARQSGSFRSGLLTALSFHFVQAHGPCRSVQIDSPIFEQTLARSIPRAY